MTKKVGIRTETFEISEDSEGITVTGLALPFGEKSRNGVRYDKDAAVSSAKSLEGTSVLFNHDESIPPVGHVEKVSTSDKGINYKMNLDPEEEDMLRKVKRGDISNVSIQALVDEDEVEGDTVKIESFMELSLAPVAGFPDTTMDMEKFVEKYSDKKEKEKTKSEPFHGFDDWEDCISTMKDQGHDQDSADKICGALQAEEEILKVDIEQSNKNSEEESKDSDNMSDEEEASEQEEKEQVDEDKIEDLEDQISDLLERVSSLEDQISSESSDEDEDEEEEESKEEETEESKEEEEEEETEEPEEETSKQTVDSNSDNSNNIKEAISEVN